MDDWKSWIIASILGIAMLVIPYWAQAAEVTLKWNQVDFETCGSNPAASGYKLYVSYDDGATKTPLGEDLTVDTLSYGPFEEGGIGKICYFATAFNQFGESGYSVPACEWVASGVPPIPSGVEALLQEIIALLRVISDKM